MTAATLMKLPADAGTWREVQGGYELRYERRLRHPRERVWTAIATPEGVARWFATADMEPRRGGRYDLKFGHPCTDEFSQEAADTVYPNTVRVYDPPSVFEHTFEQVGVVRWELHPDGDGTWLVMTHFVPDAKIADMTGYLSGWQQHLEGLEAAIAGETTPWNWDGWRALKAAYDAQVRL